MKKTLIALLFLIFGCVCVAQTLVQTPYNGSLPHPHNTVIDPFQNGTFRMPVPSTGMGFTFSFTAAERQTSAVVYNSSGTEIRTLWTNRAYPAGTWGEIWNGLDDYGNQAAAGTYTIHLTANNVQYTPWGVVGDINAHEYSPTSWDLGFEEFPDAMASIGGTAVTAEGYTEGGYSCALFQVANPIDNIHPCETASWGSDVFYDVTTDGSLFYFVDRGITSDYTGGVLAVDVYGNPHGFSAGTALPTTHLTNTFNVATTRRWSNYQVADYSAQSIPAAVTGVAVERNGSILASAHGSTIGGTVVANSSTVKLLDKLTGAVENTITISGCDPHRMTFDTQTSPNLWVVCGTGGLFVGSTQTQPNDYLVEITGIGTTDASAAAWGGSILTSPISGLSNPMALAVSPVTGDLFIADGGTNQQVFEYNPATRALVRSLGTAGGYGTGTSCNATITNYKFWFDQGQVGIYYNSQGTQFQNFVWPDDLGGLWVSDTSTKRILHYTLVGGVWTYTNRIMFQPFERSPVMETNDPTKMLASQNDNGLVEFDLNYGVPMNQGDPDPALGGNGSWSEAYNWEACIVAHPNYTANGCTGAPANFDFWKSPNNGNDIISFKSGSASTGNCIGTNAIQRMIANRNGTATVLASPYNSGAGQDPHAFALPTGGQSRWIGTDTLTTQSVLSYDTNGIPVLGSQTNTTTFPTLVPANGDPSIAGLTNPYVTPTTSGIYALFGSSSNTAASATTPKFHLVGLTPGTSTATWKALLEAPISEADGESHFPSVNMTGTAQGGTMAYTINNDIFAEFNGNGSAWSCQFWHYADDGTAIGQFGFLPSVLYPTNSYELGWTENVPMGVAGQWKAPGFCGDQGLFKVVPYGSNYVAYIGDESYIHGVHMWMISNLSSVQKLRGSGALGSTVTVH
jgi:hypothetical protein